MITLWIKKWLRPLWHSGLTLCFLCVLILLYFGSYRQHSSSSLSIAGNPSTRFSYFKQSYQEALPFLPVLASMDAYIEKGETILAGSMTLTTSEARFFGLLEKMKVEIDGVLADTSDVTIQRATRRLQYYRYFIDHEDVPFILEGDHSYSLTFLFSILDGPLVYLVIGVLLVLGCDIGCSFSFDDFNTLALVPYRRWYRLVSLWVVCIGIGLCLYSLGILFSLLVPSLMVGFGHLSWPIYSYIQQDYIALKALVLKVLGMGFLGVVYISSLVCLLVACLKKPLQTIGVGLLVVFLGIAFRAGLGSFFPLRYICMMDVVVGKVSMTLAIVLLCVSTLVQLVLAWIIDAMK